MMEKSKIILTDCDGCLLNWNAAFEKFMKSKGFDRVPGTDTDYNISSRFGTSVHQSYQLVSEFNNSQAIADLSPYADSVDNVLKLAHHGFKFIVVTALSDRPDAFEYRERNLRDVFGDVFEEIHCIKINESKAAILRDKWGDSDYFWIEDHMRQAEAGYEAGLKTILIDHPYNSHYTTDLFPRVNYEAPWKEIYEIVAKEYNL